MKNAIKNLLDGQPHDYYCIVTHEPSNSSVLLPDFITEGDELFTSGQLNIYSSEKIARESCKNGEEPLYLICLSCFLNIVRSRLGLKEMVLDGVFHCEVAAWRAPCETTAMLRNQGEAYYIEGCRDSGVYWKPISEKAQTPPPFITCGTSEIECLWYECNNGWEFMDDDPVTLCKTKNSGDLTNAHRQCIVRFDTPEIRVYYAGISPEGFDFAKSEEMAVQLNVEEAKRVARAIANVHINWSGGMMAEQSGCIVSALDENRNDLFSIKSS